MPQIHIGQKTRLKLFQIGLDTFCNLIILTLRVQLITPLFCLKFVEGESQITIHAAN